MNRELLETYNELYTQEERKKLTSYMLAEFRKLNNLQQKDVAKLIGIKPQTYGAYESGRNETPIEVLVRLSFLYNVSVDVLIQRDNMAKDEETALEQLNHFEEQMQQVREELLKATPEAKEIVSKVVDELQNLTKAIRDVSPTTSELTKNTLEK